MWPEKKNKIGWKEMDPRKEHKQINQMSRVKRVSDYEVWHPGQPPTPALKNVWAVKWDARNE